MTNDPSWWQNNLYPRVRYVPRDRGGVLAEILSAIWRIEDQLRSQAGLEPLECREIRGAKRG